MVWRALTQARSVVAWMCHVTRTFARLPDAGGTRRPLLLDNMRDTAVRGDMDFHWDMTLPVLKRCCEATVQGRLGPAPEIQACESNATEEVGTPWLPPYPFVEPKTEDTDMKLMLAVALLALLVLPVAGCAIVPVSGYGKAGGGTALVCHKGKKTMELPREAVQAHLDHGDHLGSC